MLCGGPSKMFAPPSKNTFRRPWFVQALAGDVYTSIMYDPSKNPADIERVFSNVYYAFFHLQENAQNTVQLNSNRNKTMRIYKHCNVHTLITLQIYSQSKSSVSQSVHIDQSLLTTWPFKEFFNAALCNWAYRHFKNTIRIITLLR